MNVMYEVFKEEFLCSIYLDAGEEIHSLLQITANFFENTEVYENLIIILDGDIYLTMNKNYHLINKQNSIDGFLFYRYKFEIKPNRALGKDNAVKLVSVMLENFLLNGYKSVAVCDYDSELSTQLSNRNPEVPNSN